MVTTPGQMPVRVATQACNMQRQWGTAMVQALIAYEDAALRLVDAHDGRAALLDLRATRHCRVA